MTAGAETQCFPGGGARGLQLEATYFLRFFYKKFVDLRLFSLHGLHPRNEPFSSEILVCLEL